MTVPESTSKPQLRIIKNIPSSVEKDIIYVKVSNNQLEVLIRISDFSDSESGYIGNRTGFANNSSKLFNKQFLDTSEWRNPTISEDNTYYFIPLTNVVILCSDTYTISVLSHFGVKFV